MSKQTHSTPAFPMARVTVLAEDGTPNEAAGLGHPGMTLRDYFIAHAPADPQPWFSPVLPEAPKGRIGADRKITSESREEFDAWKLECVKQHFVQWPAAWADEILKARAKALGASPDLLGFVERFIEFIQDPDTTKDAQRLFSLEEEAKALISKHAGEPQ